MSVTLQQKNNSSFSHEMQWTTDGVGRDFTGWTPSCKIKDKNGVIIHTFALGTDMFWINQALGKILFTVINTSLWPVALLKADWKNTQDSDSFARVTATFFIQDGQGIS